MTLFDTATELKVRLEAASEADAGDELLERGRTVREKLVAAANHYEEVQSYRFTTKRKNSPWFNSKKLRQAMGSFRGALRRSGPKAFQQTAAAKLLKVLARETKRLDKWVKVTWQQNFDSAQVLLSRAESDEMPGSPRARTLALKISAAKNLNPVNDRAALEELLSARGVNACLICVLELIENLRKELAAIEQAQSAVPPEVRAVLQRSSSAEGLPLGEVTPELLSALESAGVLDDLIVRRS